MAIRISVKEAVGQFSQYASELKNELGIRYNLKTPRLLDPEDLAMVGLAIFCSGDGKNYKRPNLEGYVNFKAADYPQREIDQMGISRDEWKRVYPGLIGEAGVFSNGLAAAEIRDLTKNLAREDSKQVEGRFGELFGRYLGYNNSIVGGSLVRLDVDRKRILAESRVLADVRGAVSRVADLGPGIIGFRQLDDEALKTDQFIFLEKSRFIKDAISSYAGLRNMLVSSDFDSQAPVICRDDGIKSATAELVRTQGSETLDLVKACAVQMAGEDELSAAVTNGYQALRYKGSMVFQIASERFEDSPMWMDGGKLITLASDTFRKGPTARREFVYEDRKNNIRTSGFYAVFSK